MSDPSDLRARLCLKPRSKVRLPSSIPLKRTTPDPMPRLPRRVPTITSSNREASRFLIPAHRKLSRYPAVGQIVTDTQKALAQVYRQPELAEGLLIT